MRIAFIAVTALILLGNQCPERCVRPCSRHRRSRRKAWTEAYDPPAQNASAWHNKGTVPAVGAIHCRWVLRFPAHGVNL